MGTPVQAGEVFIHDTYFPIVGPVRRVNFAVTPNPVLFGDTTKAGDAIALTQLTQTDYNGGSGVHLGNVRTDTNRCWTSGLDTTKHRALTLPPFVEDIGVPAWAGATFEPHVIVEFNGAIWVIFAGWIGSWTPTGGWAGAADRNLSANGVEAIVWGGNLYVALQSAVYQRRTPAGVWTAGTFAPITWADWDNKLWALDNGGLYVTLDGVNWTTKAARVPNPLNGYMSLCVYRDSTGASALYVHVVEGMYIYDATFDRFLPTEIKYAAAPANDERTTQVQGPDGRLYVTNGKLGVVAVQTGNPMVLTPVGLDRDDGYPASEDGTIVALAADQNFVYALQHSAANASTILRAYRGGWHTRFIGPGGMFGGPQRISNLILSSAGATTSSVYFSGKSGTAPKVWRMQLPTGVYNPRFFQPPAGYQAGPLALVTPWWPVESEVQRKIFGHIFVQAKNHTATETTKIEYATDLDENTWTLVTGAYGDANPITSNGLKEFFANIAGTQVKWIRFRITQQRGGTVGLTPIVEFYTAEFMRVLGPTYAFSVEIDLSKPHRGKTPEKLRKRIEDLIDPGVVAGFYKFSWQDELEGVRTHYGRISRESGMGFSGPEMRGQGRETLSLIVPYNRDIA